MRQCGVNFDARFKTPEDCPRLGGVTSVRGTHACASACLAQPRCKSWSFTHAAQAQGDGDGGGGGGGGEDEAKGACSFFTMTMRGVPVPGHTSGDVDPPPAFVPNATISVSGGWICSCDSGPLQPRRVLAGLASNPDTEGRRVLRSARRSPSRSAVRVPATCLAIEDECRFTKDPPPTKNTALCAAGLAHGGGSAVLPAAPPGARSGVGGVQRPSSVVAAVGAANGVTVVPRGAQVVTISEVWGSEVFHFLLENLVRWAALPEVLRARAAEAPLSSSGGGPLPPLFVHVAEKHGGGPPSERQLGLLALVGVAADRVVWGSVVAPGGVLVPRSGTCGTPTHSQVISLRRLLLAAPPFAAALATLATAGADDATEAHSGGGGAARVDGSSSDSGGRSDAHAHPASSAPAPGQLQTVPQTVPQTRLEALPAAVARAWAKPPPFDVLVVERRLSGRGIANHDALVAALEAAPFLGPLIDRAEDEGASASGESRALRSARSGKIYSSSLLSSSPRRLRVRVFSDAAMPSTQAEILAIFGAAAVVVAPHGAGLSNALVSRPCATVVEARASLHPLCYAHLADRLGFAYHSACSARQFPDEKPRDRAAAHTCPGNLTVDVPRVVRIVQRAAVEAAAETAGRGGGRGSSSSPRACEALAHDYMQSHAIATGGG